MPASILTETAAALAARERDRVAQEIADELQRSRTPEQQLAIAELVLALSQARVDELERSRSITITRITIDGCDHGGDHG